MDQIQIPWVVLAAFALFGAVQTVRLRSAARLPSSRAARRAQRASKGEADAGPLLRRLGFRIEARQARVGWRVEVDGEPVDIELRADLVVSRRRRRFVAEVKTGEHAPAVEHGPTRRQLLEYRMAFDVDGVLLVDPEAGTVREVTFPWPAPPSRLPGMAWLLTGVVIGLASAWMALSLEGIAP